MGEVYPIPMTQPSFDWIGTIVTIVTIIGVIITALTLWDAIINRRKILSYSLVASVYAETIPSSSILHSYIKNLTWGFNKQDLQVVAIRVTNNGKQNIVKGDFEKMPCFSFGDNADVYCVEIITRIPQEIEPNLNINGNVVELVPMLLNPGDSFVFIVLVRQYGGAVSVNGRIIGVQQIRHIVATRAEAKPILATFLGMPLLLIGQYYSMMYPNLSMLEYWPITLASVVGLGLVIFGDVQGNRVHRWYRHVAKLLGQYPNRR